MSTIERILKILKKSRDTRLVDLVEETGVSRQMVHRALKKLQDEGLVVKIGSAPKTFYALATETPKVSYQFSIADQDFLAEHFLLVTELGVPLIGVDAMIHWCSWQKLPVEKTVAEFIMTRKKYLAYFRPTGLIDGLKKIKTTKGFERIGVDEVYYIDFYAIERFGKTRLGILLHLAKQGQNKKLMDEIVELSNVQISKLLIEAKIDAVGFIPPTIKRTVQFMKVLEQKLNLSIPHISLTKVTGEIAIPQKALNRIEDRISNARFSIMVTEKRKFNKVLLIDDAIGSGATINETSLKLKANSIAKSVVGLAITGSFKEFDVIHEV